MSDRCPICKELDFRFANLKVHKCKPKFWCWHDDGPAGYYETDDDGTAVYADDAKDAAAKYCSEYPEHGDSWSETVVVKAADRDEWVKVDVEASIEWHADYRDPEPFVPRPLPDEEKTP